MMILYYGCAFRCVYVQFYVGGANEAKVEQTTKTYFCCLIRLFRRVSMGLTVNRQMAKKSTVNRQKRNIFTVNRQISKY